MHETVSGHEQVSPMSNVPSNSELHVMDCIDDVRVQSHPYIVVQSYCNSPRGSAPFGNFLAVEPALVVAEIISAGKLHCLVDI